MMRVRRLNAMMAILLMAASLGLAVQVVAPEAMAARAPVEPVTCDRSIALDIRNIDYKTKPFDPLLKPLIESLQGTGRIELTFASTRVHPEIADLQSAGLDYVLRQAVTRGFDPARISRQEVMLPRSFAGRDELYRLVVTYGPTEPSPAC
ncbi:MAG: hypothetical protein QM667_01825 [Asticcacaulis sp.]